MISNDCQREDHYLCDGCDCFCHKGEQDDIEMPGEPEFVMPELLPV